MNDQDIAVDVVRLAVGLGGQMHLRHQHSMAAAVGGVVMHHRIAGLQLGIGGKHHIHAVFLTDLNGGRMLLGIMLKHTHGNAAVGLVHLIGLGAIHRRGHRAPRPAHRIGAVRTQTGRAVRLPNIVAGEHIPGDAGNLVDAVLVHLGGKLLPIVNGAAAVGIGQTAVESSGLQGDHILLVVIFRTRGAALLGIGDVHIASPQKGGHIPHPLHHRLTALGKDLLLLGAQLGGSHGGFRSRPGFHSFRRSCAAAGHKGHTCYQQTDQPLFHKLTPPHPVQRRTDFPSGKTGSSRERGTPQ